MKQQFPVSLTEEQYNDLKSRLRGGKLSVLETTRIRILLLADKTRGDNTDIYIAKALGCAHNTVKNIRKKFCELGLDGAIKRKKQSSPSRKRLVDGATGARIIALACSKGENGAERWSLRLLANKIIELHIVESISFETVRQVLKKTNYNRT